MLCYVNLHCRILPYVAFSWIVFSCVLLCCRMLPYAALCCVILSCIALCCLIQPYVALCCLRLPYVALCVLLVHGPGPLKCTNSRDQPRVVRIWSLSEGDSKNTWYQSEIGSFFIFLKHCRNITKAPFCIKTRPNFKSAIEFIVSSENFVYDIKIKEISVFHSFIVSDLDIFQKWQHKK